MLDPNSFELPSLRSVWDEKRIWREPARERRRTRFIALGVGLVLALMAGSYASYSHVLSPHCGPDQTGYACTPSKMKR